VALDTPRDALAVGVLDRHKFRGGRLTFEFSKRLPKEYGRVKFPVAAIAELILQGAHRAGFDGAGERLNATFNPGTGSVVASP